MLPLPFICRLAALLLVSLTCMSAADAEENPMTVMTFNIRYDNPGDGPDRWPHRAGAVAKIIGRADVAGLQEVLHGQLTDLKQALPAYSVVGVGRDDGKQAGEYSPILYRTGRFELRESGTFWLSEEPAQIGSLGWDARIPRICTWAHLTDKESSKSFYYFNTHFDHRGSRARLESSKLIVRKITEIAGDAPVIFGGDLNATPDSEPIQALLEAGDNAAGDLQDSRSVSKNDPVGPASTWNGFREIVEDRRIDYLFVRGPVEVKSYREITERIDGGRYPSDHLPVAIEVAW